MSLILSDKNDNVITEMRPDGYINATKLCQAANKNWSDYFRLQKTQSFLEILSSYTNIPIITENKNINQGTKHLIEYVHLTASRGTYVHQLIATNVAGWCSADFSVKISIWIEEYKQSNLEINKSWKKSIENITPDEISLKKEKLIQEILVKLKGGQIEVETEHGFIDLLTDNEIIEIKWASNYKHAIGQILCYSQDYINRKKQIHLFHNNNELLEEYVKKAKKICEKYEILITSSLIIN